MVLVNEDVVEHILDSYDHWWPRDFCRLALVSSAWLQPVRKRLYSNPTLASFRACLLLIRTLEGDSRFCTLIHRLDICPSADVCSPCDSTEGDMVETYLITCRLLALTSLEHLTLGYKAVRGADGLLRNVASPHTIKSLRIVCPSVHDVMDRIVLYWDGELSLRFHALETLSLEGPFIVNIDDSHYDAESNVECANAAQRSCMLKELHLRGVEIGDTSGSLCALLQEPRSWRQMRILTFCVEDCSTRYMHDFLSFLGLAHEKLEHVTFAGLDDCGDLDEKVVEHMDHTPPLRRLCILETEFNLMRDDFQHIIASVEALEFVGVDSTSALLEWAAHVEDLRFPKLKKLVVHIDDPPLRSMVQYSADLIALTSICMEHGIEMHSGCG